MMHKSQRPVEEQLKMAAQALEPERAFSETLWNQIAATPRRVPWYISARRWLTRPVWVAAATLAAVALVLAIFTPQSVAAAFRSLLGYVPGIGFVQDDLGTGYLPEPVAVEQAGVTLVIDQAVAGPDKTVIAFHIEGLPEVKPGEVTACVYSDNKLRFPDGRISPPIGGGMSGNEARVEFMPLPAGVDHATLLVGLGTPDPACTAPAEFTAEVSFGPKPVAVTMMPVFEGEAIQATGNEATASASDLNFVIDRVAALEEGYLVAARVLWQDEAWEDVQVSTDTLEVTDASGNPVPVGPSEEGSQDNTFTFKLLSKTFTGPLTLIVKDVAVRARPLGDTPFTFDAGASPQIGQRWTLNQDLDLPGLDQKVTVRSVRAVRDEADGMQAGPANGYAFEIAMAPEVLLLDVHCTGEGEQPAGSYWSQGKKTADGSMLLEQYYSDALPTGKVTCQIPMIHFQQHGEWKTEWQVPSTAQ